MSTDLNPYTNAVAPPREERHARTRIHIYVSADLDLTVGDAWPDGDAPDHITATEVVALIEKCRTKSRFIDEWGIESSLLVEVDVDSPPPYFDPGPNHGVLFGEQSKATRQRTHGEAFGPKRREAS